MRSARSCRFSTMCRVLWSPFLNSILGSMGCSWICLVPRLFSLRSFLSCFFFLPCTHVIPIFLISFDPVTIISKLQRSTPSSKMSAIMTNSSSLATKRSLVVVPPRLLLRMLTGMVKNGRPPSNGSHPMLRRVSRLARNAPLLVQVSAPFAIVSRNHDTSLPTAPSSRN